MTEPAKPGRRRSEHARTAILQAVDDLLREVGYAELSMKGIAERAGVGRQTVYRWWSTKAEVLFEAVIADAADELRIAPRESTRREVEAYHQQVWTFLTASDAGAGYRALVGEAQHDRAVHALMSTVDLFGTAAGPIVDRAVDRADLPDTVPRAAALALLTGPCYYLAFDRASASREDLPVLTEAAMGGLRALGVISGTTGT